MALLWLGCCGVGGMAMATDILPSTRPLCWTHPCLTLHPCYSCPQQDFYTKRKPMSATINTLANALYKVFCFTGDKAHEEMRQVRVVCSVCVIHAVWEV